jgi:hypothetical protein
MNLDNDRPRFRDPDHDSFSAHDGTPTEENGSSPASGEVANYGERHVKSEEYIVQGRTDERPTWTDVETWETDGGGWSGFDTPEAAQDFCDEIRDMEDLHWEELRIVRRATVEEVVRSP